MGAISTNVHVFLSLLELASVPLRRRFDRVFAIDN
jgi:hypothetical protein